ncbi:hypothetical protein F5J12DRAFT_875810, partial [Pisolithus orientalis]|uniref:uncharacterized protein n=1 Tax=Pisolithus orientalis TaxID=936130 RepID=UPI0022249BCF
VLVSGDVTCIVSISCPFWHSTSHPLCGWDILGQFCRYHHLCSPPHQAPSIHHVCCASLQRLKVRFPTAHGLSAFQLFISVFMLTSKVICDNTVGAECGSLDA